MSEHINEAYRANNERRDQIPALMAAIRIALPELTEVQLFLEAAKVRHGLGWQAYT